MIRRRRAEHGEVHRTDLEVRTDRRRKHRQPARVGHAVHDVDSEIGLSERTADDLRDLPAVHHARQPGDVVEVEVRDHQQRDVPDAEVAQTSVDLDRIGAGIDLDSGARPGRKQQRVALTDVARGEHPPGRRPAGCRRTNRDEHDQRSDQRSAEDAPGTCPRRHDDDNPHRHRQQQAALAAAGPRNGRTVQSAEEVGYLHQPPTRPAGDPGQYRSGAEPDRGDRCCREAEHGDRGDHRLGEHVRGDRDDAHPPADRRDDRRRDDVCRGSHRNCLGDADRHPMPAQRRGPTRCDQQQRRRGEYRHGEGRAGGQGRVPRNQCEHDRGQRRHARARAPAGEGDERDHRHQGGAQHARRWAGHHDEHRHDARPDERAHHRPRPQPTQQKQDRADDDRAVRATYRDEVGQAGHPEPFGEHRVEIGLVAVDQPGKQASLLIGKNPRRLAERRADPPGHPLPPGRPADELGRIPGEERHRQDGTAEVRQQSPGDPRPLPGQHVLPSVGTAEDDDRPVDRHDVPTHDHRLGAGFDQHPRRPGHPGRRQRCRVGARRQRDNDGPVFASQGEQWRGSRIREPAGQRQQFERDAEQQQCERRGRSPVAGRAEQDDSPGGRTEADGEDGAGCRREREESRDPPGSRTQRQPEIERLVDHSVTSGCNSANVTSPIPLTSVN